MGEDGELGCEYSTCGGRGLRGECGIEMEGDDMVGAAAEIWSVVEGGQSVFGGGKGSGWEHLLEKDRGGSCFVDEEDESGLVWEGAVVIVLSSLSLFLSSAEATMQTYNYNDCGWRHFAQY